MWGVEKEFSVECGFFKEFVCCTEYSGVGNCQFNKEVYFSPFVEYTLRYETF